jgi:TonB family protein
MNTIINFIFWTSAYFFLLGIIYHLLIRPQGNPAFSRSFLLGGVVVSLLAGLGVFIRTAGIITNEVVGAFSLPEVVVYASDGLEKSQFQIRDILFARHGILYLSFAISVLIFLRIAGSLVYLVIQWRILKGQNINGMYVIPMRGDQTPFSFFRLVFIPERLFGDRMLDQVLLHERAHVVKLHSMDLVFIELLSIFFWFHPVIWYLRREIKMQHEFEADRYVLEHDVDKAFYQQLLINYSFRTYCHPVTNPFNFSPLKKRVMMMNKQAKRSISGIIFGISASVTLFAGMLLLQSISLEAREISALQRNSLTEASGSVVIQPEFSFQPLPQPPPPPVDHENQDDQIFSVVENPPTYPGGEEARIRFLQEKVRFPSEARDAGLQGTVFISFVIEKDGSISDAKVERGVGESLDQEALRVVKAMPNWNPGRQRGQAVRVQYTMPIRFVLNTEKSED